MGGGYLCLAMVFIGQNKKLGFLIWVAVGVVQAASRARCGSVREAHKGCRELGERWGAQPHWGHELNKDPALKQPPSFLWVFCICTVIVSRV